MNETKKLPEPQAGGRYVRRADDSLEQIHTTKPAEGRTERSRLVRERQLAAGQEQNTQPSPVDTHEE